MRLKLIFLYALLLFWSATCLASEYILSSTPDGKGPIKVDDDITITLEGADKKVVLVDDEDHEKTEIPPIVFRADKGDKLTVEAKDYAEPAQIIGNHIYSAGHKELSPLYLVNARTGRAVCIFGGVPKSKSDWRGGYDTFATLTYTIGTPTKLYCFSSSPDACEKVKFSDDFPLFSLTSGNMTFEIHVDTDGDSSSRTGMVVAIPMTGENPTIKLEFSNTYGNAYTGPIYLVPVNGKGRAIPILEHKVQVEGHCKDYGSCTETVFYSYEGPLYRGQYLENELFSVEYYPLDDEDVYGFGVCVDLFVDYPVPMYIYFTEPDGRNVFLTASGVRYKGRPVPIGQDFCAEYAVPRYMDYEKNAFVAGTYQVNIADSTGRFIYPYSYTIDTLSGDISSASSSSLPSSVLQSAHHFIDSDELFLVSELGTPSFGGGVPFSFLEQETNATVTCTVKPASGSGYLKNGLTVKPMSVSDYKLFFVLGVYCTSNGTEVSPPEDLSLRVSFEVNGGSIQLSGFEPIELSGVNGTYYYAEFPLIDADSVESLSYSFSVSYGWESKTLGPYTYELPRVRYVVKGAPGYANGADVNFAVSKGGLLYSYIAFALEVESVNGSEFDPSDLRVYACIDTNGDLVEDARVELTYDETEGLFKSSAPYVINLRSETQSQLQLSYYFLVESSAGYLASGLILQNVFTLTLTSGPYPIAARIGGDRKLKLGEEAEFSFFIRTGETLEETDFDIYLGLYRKGRGIVWISTRIPGAWVPATSAEEKPLVHHAYFSDFRDGRWMLVNFRIPSDKDPEALLYPGSYAWVLRLAVHNPQTDEVSDYYYAFPFSITTP